MNLRRQQNLVPSVYNQFVALEVSFNGGAVMGLAVASLGLVGVGIAFIFWLGLYFRSLPIAFDTKHDPVVSIDDSGQEEVRIAGDRDRGGHLEPLGRSQDADCEVLAIRLV